MQNELISQIGKRIKTIRNEKGITLQKLSECSSLSKGLLSKIENSRTVPSLPVFLSIMKGIEISPKDFFDSLSTAGIGGNAYAHFKKKDYKKLKKEERPGFDYKFILAQSLSNCLLETVVLTIKPKTKGKPTVTDGFEFKYVVSGDCEYHVGDDKVALNEGDSIYFDASVPHYPINQSKRKVVMLVMYFLKSQ